jgi:hypothetical protein
MDPAFYDGCFLGGYLFAAMLFWGLVIGGVVYALVWLCSPGKQSERK